MKTLSIPTALTVLLVALLTGPALAELSPRVRVVTGTVVRVALKLSDGAADMHAMEVRVGDGSEIPAWFYDRKDKDLGRFKTEDVVEIKFVTVLNERDSRKRNRNDIRDIRKVEGVPGVAPSGGGAKAAPAVTSDLRELKALVDKGELARARVLVDARAKAEGGYQALGDTLRDAGLYSLAQYAYTTAIDTGRKVRGAAYKARKSLVALYQGPYSPDLSRIADGTYEGACFGYLGPNTVKVTVKNHAITDVSVKSPDNRPLTSLKAIPPAIVSKQGIQGVDAITGATITSHAIMAGACTALKDAEK